jgi:hypothetical protein
MDGDTEKRDHDGQEENESDKQPDIAFGTLTLKIGGEYGRA